MSGNENRLGPAPLKNMNAFHLPKLKKDVASKFPGSSRPGSKEGRQHTVDGPENVDGPSISPPTSPGAKLTTTRKSKRAKARTGARQSEVTVYFDCSTVQSPDDAASTRAQHKPRGARNAPAHAEPAAAGPALEEAADAELVADDLFFATQPEPMEADDDVPYLAPPDAVEKLEPPTSRPASRAASRQQQQGASRGTRAASEEPEGADADTVAHSNRHKSRNNYSNHAAAAGSSGCQAAPAAVEGQQQQQQLRDGQEIFKYMQQLAEDAAELLPQEQEQKKRGRGRAKKDLRLVDALHQCWKGKSYYERLQEITRQEVEEQEEEAAALAPAYRPLAGRQDADAAPASQDTSAAPAAGNSRPAAFASSSQQQQEEVQEQQGSQGARKRRTVRQGSRPESADTADGNQGVGAGTAVDDGSGAAAAAAVPSSKRRATAAGSKAAAGTAAAGTAGSRSRRATMAPSAAVASSAAAAAAAAAAGRSPSTAVGSRPGSSRPNLTWETTPAAAAAATAGGSNIADRPPWSVGGAAGNGPFGAIGVAATGAGPAAVAGAGGATGKADRGALQKLQAAFDAKCEELAAAKEQLKDSQDLVAKLKQDQKAHPKALQQLEKQRQALEKKVDAGERKAAALERDNEALHDRLVKQESEKAALQEQLTKSDKEVKALRLKLKQACAKLDKCQALGAKLQEMGASLVTEAQAVAME